MSNNNIFKLTEHVKRPYNYFDLSHSNKLTLQFGRLVPTLVLECIPGDKFEISVESLTRFMPLVAPVMHKFKIDHHFFFVPNRLLWEDWDDFISGNGSFTTPYITGLTSISEGDLGDYMGLPPGLHTDTQINAMPFAAYALIFDEYYKDQRIDTTQYFYPLTEGTSADNAQYSSQAVTTCQLRCYSHDYFTSALPYPQEGSSATVLPVTHSGDDPLINYNDTGTGNIWRSSASEAIIPSGSTFTTAPGGSAQIDGTSAILDPNGRLYADISNDAGTIADLRQAIKLQEFLEKDSRSGLRYTEQLYARFGIRSKDMRLDRPEYIGGASSNLVVSEVLSSTETIDNAAAGSEAIFSPIGSMAGHGVGVTGGNRFKYFCEEWGWIMCITSIMPESDYFQGVHKMWQRNDRLDYYFHEFALIGEQAITTGEIYAVGETPTQMSTEFGYIPRYSEMKFLQNRISGEFRSTLDHWHSARTFSSAPSLNKVFLACFPTYHNTIFADMSEGTHQILMHLYFNIGAYRQMPKFANPTL